MRGAERGALGGVLWTQYIYDAEGRRVAKGINTAGTCDPAYFQATNIYVLGQGGEQVTETEGSGNWLHTNVYAGGALLATYDGSGLHFQVSDWLGTRRVQTDDKGRVEQTWQSLPFGEMVPQNNLSYAGALGATEQHFTGKERDTESGNDYMFARYYNSNTGRFLSPDWSAKEDPVPYASLANPQTLNLYAYVGNNPLDRVDLDGHFTGDHAFSDYFATDFKAAMNQAYQMDVAAASAQRNAHYQAQAFNAIWKNYPSHEAYGSGTAGTSGESVQQLTGVDVVDTCALRMSYALNQSGFTISKHSGRSVMEGADGKYYLVAQADVGKFVTQHFGSPQNIGKSGVAGFDQSAVGSGIVRFSIQFATGTATGHIALFRNGSYHEGAAEDDYTTGDPGHYAVQGIQYWRMQ